MKWAIIYSLIVKNNELRVKTYRKIHTACGGIPLSSNMLCYTNIPFGKGGLNSRGHKLPREARSEQLKPNLREESTLRPAIWHKVKESVSLQKLYT